VNTERGSILSRRGFIGSALSAGVAAALPLPSVAQGRPSHPLVPVKVDTSRVIRTVVGLRPYRPAGFVLRAQPFGEKTLVHDYGHGGGGFSLSWGCATMAADFVSDRTPTSAAVIGSGVIGLSTARVLQDRGWDVTIYAANLPPQTTSNVAGAQWSPVSLFDRPLFTPEFRTTLDRAARLANRAFQLMVGPYYGVRWIENYTLRDGASDDDEIDTAVFSGFADLYADVETIDPSTTPFATPFVRRFTTMLIEPNTYLPAVMRDFELRGGKIVVRKFDDVGQLNALHEPALFNCTGLGARALFGDTELVPVRGQLTVLEPQPEVDYITVGDKLYMFPRNDGILLGGTFERGNWSLEPDLARQAKILAAQAAVYRA
jgi:D-amino-acid oxidase